MNNDEELWETIPDFRDYAVSSFGRIYNRRRDSIMRSSLNNHGHAKISLISDVDGKRHTKSVAQLVALAFVEAPTGLCDQVVVLDGDHRNTAAYNLAWRPAWFAWKYSRQLKTLQPAQFENLTIRCVNNGAIYSSVVDAGMKEGLLFQDVWRSTFTRAEIFPGGLVFEVVRKSIGD